MPAIRKIRFVKLGDAKRLTHGGGDHGVDWLAQPMEPQG